MNGEKDNKSFWHTLPGILIGAAAIITAITGLYVAINGVKEHPSPITITSPKDGDNVPYSTAVSGTLSGKLPEGRYIWVVTNPYLSPDNWWPQVGQVEPVAGLWSIQVYIGIKDKDNGMKHNIDVITVNETDDQFLKDYIDEAKKTGNYPGIPLPASAIIMHTITVTRI